MSSAWAVVGKVQVIKGRDRQRVDFATGVPEFDSSEPQNSHIPNGINRLAVLFETLVVARFKL